MLVKEHHIVAKDVLSLYRLSNKPKFGPVYQYHSLRVSRARFKYALKYNNNNNMYLKSSIQTSSMDYNIHITLNLSSNIPFQYTKNIITNT